MSMIETLSDEKNSFLSRREIICDFKGLGGKLKKLEAVEMITKEFKLDGKIVIPMKLQNHTGQPKITGTFYVYDDEKLARKHVSHVIFDRLDKAKNTKEEKKDDKAADAEPAKADAELINQIQKQKTKVKITNGWKKRNQSKCLQIL